ncbi:GntR family transcriptional regulator [Solimonas variicoloris]|uniref:GntR family transcriptional regulator n=1 Tax=Solimonas variicoloris TaxID=254408 RepID=UPI000380DE29|nr:GntR family transcriptional regulator [Solimonas variicoloris]
MSTPLEMPPSERIAAELVQRINDGRLRPGERIVEQALADEFGTSRGPVRDALKVLAARNWIDLLPRHGARVAHRERAPALETALIGAAMLGLACRFAVTKARDAEVEAFFARVRRVVQLGRDEAASAEAFAAAAREAGYYIIALADNRCIDDIIGPVPRGALSGYAAPAVASAEARLEAAQRWEALAVAFRLRDPVRAEAAGRAIVEAALQRMLLAQLQAAGGA